MQTRLTAASAGAQLGLEHVPEEAVDTVELALPVGSGHEQVGVGERTQTLIGVPSLEHDIADVRAELVEDRRADQEVRVLGSRARQDLLARVLGELVVGGLERHIAANLAVSAQDQRGEVDRGGPSLGALDDEGPVPVVHVDAGGPEHRDALCRTSSEDPRP